jgi:hypothetical protein
MHGLPGHRFLFLPPGANRQADAFLNHDEIKAKNNCGGRKKVEH